MAFNVIDLMDQQSVEGARSTVPFFFRLGDTQRASIRPLLNLDGACEVWFHKIYNPQGKFYVESTCARVIGKKCQLCEDALRASDRKAKKDMSAKQMFMLPVWLYNIKTKKIDDGMAVLDENDNPVFEDLTYTNKETGEKKLVSGVRVLQLMFKESSFARVADTFRLMYKAGNSIADRDFLIERHGSGTDTSYEPSKRNPSPFSVKPDFDVTEEWVRQSCINNYPPQIVADGYRARGTSDTAIDAVVQGVKNAHDDIDSIADF